MGGKDLDLHRLFVEVTSRGGITKVRMISILFHFDSSVDVYELPLQFP